MPKLNRDGVEHLLRGPWRGAGDPAHPRLFGDLADVERPDRGRSSKDHKLVIWDMRGHGQSDYPDDQAAYSEEATVADMAALLDAVGAKNAIIGGLSLGGYMSLAFNRAHPERIAGPADHRHRPGLQERRGPRRLEPDRPRSAPSATRRDGLAVLANGSAEVRTARHRDADGLARAARGMLTQRDAG